MKDYKNDNIWSSLLNTREANTQLTNEETKEALEAVFNSPIGSAKAKNGLNKLYMHNVKYIYKKALFYINKDINKGEDIFQAATEGFFSYFYDYDEETETNCKTKNTLSDIEKYTDRMDLNHALLYVLHFPILGKISEHFRLEHPFLMDKNEYKTYNKVKKALDEVSSSSDSLTERDCIEEVANQCTTRTSRVTDLLQKGQSTVSLSTIINEDGNTLDDLITSNDEGPEEEYFTKRNDNLLKTLLNNTLTPTEHYMINHIFEIAGNEKMQIQEIARYFNKSRQWVHNTYQDALRKLRNPVMQADIYAC